MKKFPTYLIAALLFFSGFSSAHATVLFPSGGGTGTSTTPTYGEVLVGNTLGTYSVVATSTLGYITTDITEGTKLFFTNARAIAATLTGFSATTGTVTSSDSILVALEKLAGNAATYLTNITGLITNGTGIGLSGSGTSGSPYSISNTGVTSNVAGTGIGVSGATGAVTISNTGVTSIVAGTNITVSGATGAVTVNSTASGGGSGTVSTSTHETSGNLAYWTSNSATPALLGQVATGTVANGTGISVTAGQSVIGSGLTITNTSPLSGLVAAFPFSFSNPTLTWLGLATSSNLVSGQPLYATGVNTFQSVSSSTFLTSIGGQVAGNYIAALTGDVTASGPGSAAATLATVNTNTGSWGSSTAIPNFTVNGKGLITAAGTNAVIAPAGTLSGTILNSTVVTSSLTSVGTLSALTISGNLTLSALTGTQCLQEISGVVSGTGSACGSGSGGVTSVTGTYPVISSGGSTPAISLAFGTTTANTWSALNTFNGGLTIGSFTGTLNSNSGVVYPTATSTPSLGSGLAYTGTLGQFIAGTSGTLSVSGLTTSNFTSANVSQWTNDAGYLTSSTGVTSLKQTYGTAQTGALTLATTSASFNGLTVADAITNSAGTFTVTPLWSGTLNNAGLTNSSLTVTAGTGLSGGGAISLGSSASLSVNTSQNITTLSNLTVAGFVQTTAAGLLSSAALTSGQVTTALGFTPGQGTVTAIGVTTNQGVSGSSSGGATPNLTLTLGALTGVTSLNGLVVTANTGVITTGTWNATTIAINHGGTNQTSFNTNAISYFDGSSLNSSTNFLWQPLADWFTVGTTSSARSLATLATSTASQLTLTDGVSIPWNFRSVGGNFYLATSSLTTFATSTNPLLSIIPSATANATTTWSLTDFLIEQTSQTAFQIADAFGTIDALFNTASTTGSIFTVAATTSPSIYNPTKLFDVDQYGGITASSTGATPTVACSPSGGTLAANSNDQAGTITGGTLSTSCTLTFAHTKLSSPVVLYSSSGAVTLTSQSTTNFVLGLPTATGVVINYFVVQP